MRCAPADMARLLSAAGGRTIDAQTVEADIAAGAPTNPDGTMNLVHYAAWLVHRWTEGGSRPG